MLHMEKSAAAFAEAKTLMPGGVNSPVRSYRSVDCDPPFIARAEGSRIYDIDGNEYIDYVGSWGPMVVGHAHPRVVRALQQAATRGTSYGAPTLIESELAKKIQKLVKDSKLKLQASIQGDSVRISGTKKDDLQTAMALIRKEVDDFPLSFNNFRD